MWREKYIRYYCNNCDRYFYIKNGFPDSPMICCPDCNNFDTEPMPFETEDPSFRKKKRIEELEYLLYLKEEKERKEREEAEYLNWLKKYDENTKDDEHEECVEDYNNMTF